MSKISNLKNLFEPKSNQPKQEVKTQATTYPKKVENGKVENNQNKLNNQAQNVQKTQNVQKEKQTSSQNGKTTQNNGQINNSGTHGVQTKKVDSTKFPKDFNDYLQKIKSIKHPLKDCEKLETIKFKEKALNIYKYSAKYDSSNDDGASISILFVGQSGAGKSTIINAYANFLLGVFHDQPCRYKIVLGNKEKEKDQTKSQTDDITIYNIQSPLYPGITFKLIDTPGVADTRNKDTGSKMEKNSMDKINFGKFEDFFNTTFAEEENGLINGICFVVKASDNRVTEFQKLIISSVLNLFGKNAGSNFLALLTHSDTGKPDAIKVMTQEIPEFKKKEKEKKKWNWCISSIKYFEGLEDRQSIGGFEDNIDHFISFTNEIINLPAIDTTLTQKNLSLKKYLDNLKKTIKDEYLKILLQKYNTLKESEKKLNEQIEKCKEKQKELKAKEDALKVHTDKQKEIQDSIDSLQNEIKNNEKKITNCKNDINKFQNELTKYNSEIASLERENQKDEEEKQRLNSEKEKAKNKINNLKSQLKTLKQSNNLDKNIAELQKQLDQQNNNLKNLDTNLTNLNKKKDEIQNKINYNKNQKAFINNKIEASKKEINIMNDENKLKENEQQNIRNKYNDLDKDSRKNSSIDMLNEYIWQLEESKKAKKTITESYIDTILEKCDKRTLRCTECKKNCHVGCYCSWGLFIFFGVSWFCNNIAEGHCKVCDCHYKKHERECKWYRHETKQRDKIVGLSDKEIKEIDKNINEVQEKIKKEKQLLNMISKIDEQTKTNERSSMNLTKDIANNEKTKEELKKKKVETEKQLSNQIQEKNSIMEKTTELNKNEKQFKQNESQLKNKEKKIEENKEKKQTLESEQKNTEKIISKKSNDIKAAEMMIESKSKDIGKEKEKKEKLEREVKKLKQEKDKLFNIIKQTFEKEKDKLQKEKDEIDKTIKNTEDETIKQIIKMKIIMEEIKKIEIKSDETQTFEKQLNEILEDNKDFIRNAESFAPLTKKINEALNEREEIVLKKYGINKDDLVNFKPPKNKKNK